ncbi:MAG: hypothetical protein MRY72_05075 [Aquisalinus sp.]|nr:hypothetical protein [Aquisalinus sp.]
MKLSGVGTLRHGDSVLGRVNYNLELGSETQMVHGRGGLGGPAILLWEAYSHQDLTIQLEDGDLVPLTVQSYAPAEQWVEIQVQLPESLH